MILVYWEQKSSMRRFNKYTFSFGIHHNKEIIWITFPYSFELKNGLKKRFSSVKWNQSNKNGICQTSYQYEENFKSPSKIRHQYPNTFPAGGFYLPFVLFEVICE